MEGYGTRPPEFGVGTLIQIVPLPRVLSCFKISSTRLLALQCYRKLTNPITPTAIHYFPKVHLQRPSSHHFR